MMYVLKQKIIKMEKENTEYLKKKKKKKKKSYKMIFQPEHAEAISYVMFIL